MKTRRATEGETWRTSGQNQIDAARQRSGGFTMGSVAISINTMAILLGAVAARNGPGRRREYLTVHSSIASEWPPCTTWSGADGSNAKTVQWSSSLEVLQKPDGMELDQEVSDTVLVLAVHDHQPAFENGQVNYRFPVGPAVRTESSPRLRLHGVRLGSGGELRMVLGTF